MLIVPYLIEPSLVMLVGGSFEYIYNITFVSKTNQLSAHIIFISGASVFKNGKTMPYHVYLHFSVS